jgi:surfeit locus 1 family protein
MNDPESDRTLNLSGIERQPRSLTVRIVLALCGAVLFAGFVGLGTWQVFRLQWKENLIARVEERIHAPPADAPPPDQWKQVNAGSSEYRRVQVAGTFLHELSAKVQASTRLGSGYWVMTPLRMADGNIVFINRGFIPPGMELHSSELCGQAHGTLTVMGLLRISEPGGGFLRDNDPANERWYSRDIKAIASARGLAHVAPYFIDADMASPVAKNEINTYPVGGMTVVSFPNNHLVYALTWYALALMVAGTGFWIVRTEQRSRRS